MLRLIWNLSIRIRAFLRIRMPTNILLDALRSRRGLKFGVPAMLLAAGYLAIAHWCTTVIAAGGPGWLHLVVLVCIINAFKFLIYGPLSLIGLIRVRRSERRRARANDARDAARDRTPGAPAGELQAQELDQRQRHIHDNTADSPPAAIPTGEQGADDHDPAHRPGTHAHD